MLLKNGTLVNGEKKDILIIDGKIAEIADYIDLERAKKLSLEKEVLCEITDYHTMKIFKNGAKLSCDSIEHYYSDLPMNFTKDTINDYAFTIIWLKSLIEVYIRGRDTIIHKKDEYQKKIDSLNALQHHSKSL